MNAKIIVTSTVLTLALGMAAPAFAQDQKQGDKQGQKPQQHAQQQPAPQQHAQQQPAQRQQPAPQQHAQQQPAQRQQPAPQQHAQQQPAQRQQPALSSMRSNSQRSGNNNLSAPQRSSVPSRRPGKIIAQETGSPTTAAGNNGAGTTATVCLTPGTTSTLGSGICFGSTDFPSWFLMDTRVSSTTAIGLRFSTHGRDTGRMTGMTPTTSTWFTRATVITCTTTGIRASELPSASRCNGAECAPFLQWQGRLWAELTRRARCA